MRKSLAISGGLVLIFLIVGFSIINRLQITEPKPEPKSSQIEKQSELTPESLLAETNKVRQLNGALPVSLHPELVQAAQAKSDDMRKYDYYGHVNPYTGQGVPSFHNCLKGDENLAAPTTTAQRTVYSWFGSDRGHREALLNKEYNLVGFGISKYKNTSDRYYVTQYLCKSV